MSSFPLWIAQYASECSCKSPNLVCWQYDSEARVDGVMTLVDVNIGYDNLLKITYRWDFNNGKWYCYQGDSCIKSQWVKDNGLWYYLDKDGVMLTGVQIIDGERYLLNPGNYDGLPLGACVITNSNGVLK